MTTATTATSPLAASPLAYALGVFRAVWMRDMLRMRREPSRWVGVALQPIFLWLVIGAGIGGVFRMRGADDLHYTTFFFPGVIVMTLLFTTIFATITVVEDRQSGFLQSVLVAPGHRTAMVLGKVAGVATICALQLVLVLPLAPFASYPLAAIAWPALFAAIALTIIALSASGFAIAWLMPSPQAYHGIMSVILLPAWVVSGALFPPPEGPLGAIIRANPMTYAVEAVRAALSPITPPGSVSATLPYTVLIVFAALAVTVATAVSRRGQGALR